jgi:hypothetical protein
MLHWFLYSALAFQLIPRIKIGIKSITECNSGTAQKMPFGVNTAIELKKRNYIGQYWQLAGCVLIKMCAGVVVCS